MEWAKWLQAVEESVIRAGGKLTGPVEYDDNGARFPFEFVVGHVDRIASKQIAPYAVLNCNGKTVASLGWPPDSSGDYVVGRVANFFVLVADQWTEDWRPYYLRLRDEVRTIVDRKLPGAFFIEQGIESEWRDAVAWQFGNRVVTMGLSQAYDGPNLWEYVMIESGQKRHFENFTTKPDAIAALVLGYLSE